LRISRYEGVMPTVIGNMRPAENNAYISGAERNLYRAMTKLTMMLSTTTPTMVAMPTMVEFFSSVPEDYHFLKPSCICQGPMGSAIPDGWLVICELVRKTAKILYDTGVMT
jgi:hypothetical protein